MAAAVALPMLSGCADQPGPVVAGGRAVTGSDPVPAAAAFRFDGEVRVGLEPPEAPPAASGPCKAATSACRTHGFQVPQQGGPQPAKVTLELRWGNGQNDFDLLLLDAGGTVIAGNFSVAPGGLAVVETYAAPGSYAVVVAAYRVVLDAYGLEVRVEPTA